MPAFRELNEKSSIKSSYIYDTSDMAVLCAFALFKMYAHVVDMKV